MLGRQLRTLVLQGGGCRGVPHAASLTHLYPASARGTRGRGADSRTLSSSPALVGAAGRVPLSCTCGRSDFRSTPPSAAGVPSSLTHRSTLPNTAAISRRGVRTSSRPNSRRRRRREGRSAGQPGPRTAGSTVGMRKDSDSDDRSATPQAATAIDSEGGEQDDVDDNSSLTTTGDTDQGKGEGSNPLDDVEVTETFGGAASIVDDEGRFDFKAFAKSNVIAREMAVSETQTAIRNDYIRNDFESALVGSEMLKQMCITHYKREHTVTASAFCNTALMLKMLGRYDESVTENMEALEIYEKVVGQDHASYAATLSNLGHVFKMMSYNASSSLERLGLLERAKEHFEKVLEIRSQVHEEGHPELELTRNILASTRAMLPGHKRKEGGGGGGDGGAEEKTLRNTVQALRSGVGEGHSATATAINNLGFFLKSAGRYAEAKDLYDEALAIRTNLFGLAHQATFTTRFNIVELLSAQGKTEEANAMADDILKTSGLPEKTVEEIAAEVDTTWSPNAQSGQGAGEQPPTRQAEGGADWNVNMTIVNAVRREMAEEEGKKSQAAAASKAPGSTIAGGGGGGGEEGGGKGKVLGTVGKDQRWRPVRRKKKRVGGKGGGAR